MYRAVKRIPKSRDFLGSGWNEAHVLKNISHPSLPIIYDVYEDDVYLYIVEEYIEGENLKDYVKRRGRLVESEAAGFSIDICRALVYLGGFGICHMDIKPENIIITGSGLKLLDFGSSLLAGETKEFVCGTKGYAAPEMYYGGRFDQRSDIYAVGMLMVFMLTGRDGIYESDKLFCSDNLYFIIHKCISHGRRQRYADVGELISALEKSQTSLGTTSNPMVISVYGCGGRIGCTHLSVMLASHFSHYGKCLLRLKGTCMPPVYPSVSGMGARAGVYSVGNIKIVPDYNGFAMPEVNDGFAYVIRDMGCDFGDLSDAGEVILVMGHTLGEIREYVSAADKLRSKGVDFITAVNFTDGKEYAGIRKEQHMTRAFRIPYCVRPFSFVDVRGSIEKEIIGWNKNYRCGRSLRRMWSDAFRSVCGQLSVKCKRH